MKAAFKFRYPLVDEVRRTQYCKALDVATVEQFSGYKCSLDGLANTDVVGDEQPYWVQLECHQQRHELVGARLHGDLAEAAERARATAERQHKSITKEERRIVTCLLARLGWWK